LILAFNSRKTDSSSSLIGISCPFFHFGIQPALDVVFITPVI